MISLCSWHFFFLQEQLKDYDEIKKTMETGGTSYKETKLQRQVDNLLAEREDLLSQIKVNSAFPKWLIIL